MDKRYIVLFVLVERLSHVFGNDGTESDPLAVSYDFLKPQSVADNVDIFTRGENEYIFVNSPVQFKIAGMLCKMNYFGNLAIVKDRALADFLAEALSETNLMLDTLWVGGVKINTTWIWLPEQETIDASILELLVKYSNILPALQRDHLGFCRNSHDQPLFPQLTDTVLRPFICERPVGRNKNGSTHVGWIKLGPRLYKIFADKVTWEDAQTRCIMQDQEARLAVLTDFLTSQHLGRYLLIGRPSLENAWIGGRWKQTSHHFEFEQEHFVLSNNTGDASNYPPWRFKKTSKNKGCLLLDRHLANVTYFVEARCERQRSYICYKMANKSEDDFNDVIIGDNGYRLFYTPLPWEDAQAKCASYRDYGGMLAEVQGKQEVVHHLIYVMGENKTAVQHIWLGGKYDLNDRNWHWSKTGKVISPDELEWLPKSTKYLDNLEKDNVCLNMDRENHITPMHYGTICKFPQNFVCMFTKENLEKLQTSEANKLFVPATEGGTMSK